MCTTSFFYLIINRSTLRDIKQKATNKANQLIDIDKGMVVNRGDGGWGEDEHGKGGQICGDGKRLGFGW